MKRVESHETGVGGAPTREAHQSPSPSTLWKAAVLTILLTGALWLAKPVFLPVILAVLASMVLAPLVRRMKRVVPPPIGAALGLVAFYVIVGVVAWQTVTPAREWFQSLPSQIDEVRYTAREVLAGIEDVRAATEEVEELAAGGAADAPGVVVDTTPSLPGFLMIKTGNALGMAFATTALLYFLLATENAFLVRLLRFCPGLFDEDRGAGPAAILESIENRASRYLLTITAINVCLGILVGLSAASFGVANAPFWGLLATLLNFLPYLGALVGVTLLALSSLLTGGDLVTMLGPPIAYLALTVIEGTFVAPAILGRRLKISPVAIMIALLFWGWLWGVIGALLAVPLLVVMTVASQHVPELAPFFETDEPTPNAPQRGARASESTAAGRRLFSPRLFAQSLRSLVRSRLG